MHRQCNGSLDNSAKCSAYRTESTNIKRVFRLVHESSASTYFLFLVVMCYCETNQIDAGIYFVGYFQKNIQNKRI